MKIKLMALLCLLMGISISAFATILPTKTYNNITYLANTESNQLKRYSHTIDDFLLPITLTGNPWAFHVDESGIYLSYGNEIKHVDHTGNNESLYRSTSQEVHSLLSTDDYLIVAGYGYLLSINKSSGILADEYEDRLQDTGPNIALSPNKNKIYATSYNNAYVINIDDNGQLNQAAESFYTLVNDPTYYPVPGSTHVLDNYGSVYNAANLTPLIKGTEDGEWYTVRADDTTFWQGLPIVLRNNALHALNKAYQSTGSQTVSIHNAIHTESFTIPNGDETVTFNMSIERKNGTSEILSVTPTLNFYTTGTYARGDLESANAVQQAIFEGQHGALHVYDGGGWSYWLSNDENQGESKKSVTVINDKAYVFSTDKNETLVQIIDIADLSPADPNAKLDANGLKFNVDAVQADANNDYLYVLSQAHASIFVWSVIEQKFIDTIALTKTPTEFTYAEKWQRIYMSADDGSLFYLDLSDNSITTLDWQEKLSALVSAGDFIVGKSSEQSNNYLLDKEGQILDTQYLSAPVDSMVWDANKNRIYYLTLWSPADLEAVNINPITKQFAQQDESDFHDGNGWANPLSVSSNGHLIANATGRVSTAAKLGEKADILNDGLLTDLAWLQGNLFSLKGVDSNSYSKLQRWQADFTEYPLDAYEVQGTPIKLIALANKQQLALVYSSDTQINIELLDFVEHDFDNDGYLDSADELPADASDHLDNDGDGVGNSADIDDDNDGVMDDVDKFPFNTHESTDNDNDAIGDNQDPDDDNDGVNDDEDIFPFDPNESIDSDWDNIGNTADLDDDNDGVNDEEDAFPLNPHEQYDHDKDGMGNEEDQDDDNDGVLDYEDRFPTDPAETTDLDHDGIGDNSDPDIDGDNTNNDEDPFPLDSSEWADTDNDGIGNNTDSDDDGDGISDANDYYPTNAAKSAITASDYFLLNAGSTWQYNGNNARISSAINIAGQNITPLTFTQGSKLYLKVVDNKVQLFGFYLPTVYTNYGDFSTDIRLDKGINLLQSNTGNGSGNVNISPTYGDRSMTWSARTRYQTPESLSLPAGQFDTLHTQISFTGAVNIDGADIRVTYDVSFWFAEGIGIVQVAENGYSSELTNYTITNNAAADASSNNANGNTSNNAGGDSGGGGSTHWWLFTMLTVSLLIRRKAIAK
ncbi:thrombospondin type 3 repeat-containing protein [Algibacillus agarilyticus]|uniref:thrombospondin type 3 repeat-containing protein n=1 Tax=Algibacillus agarilyticus TaxID=2234133 RepID=UPI001300BE57|nr:thrombospondin type 3 repeat-containing protein [Algibacillus agarilyticus]